MSLYDLERTGDVHELIRLLEESETTRVRKRAAEILGRMDEHDDREDIVSALVRAADTDDSEEVVAAAIDGLNQLGGDALQALIVEMAGIDLGAGAADWKKAKAFVRALDAQVPELRMAAANALGELGQSQAISELVDRFDDEDPRVRARAARACGLIEDARGTEGLIGLLSDPIATVRREAANALGRIGNRQALQALLTLYDDDSERVRRIAVSGFGKFTSDRPVEPLTSALGDESSTVRRTAVFSMIELLSNVPTDQSHEIRESVVEEISASNDGTVIAPLVEILQRTQNGAPRRNTAWLLGRVLEDDSNRDAVDALLDALVDGEEMTRQFAATSLAQLEGSYVENELFEIAENTELDSQARAQALFTLGKIGDLETAERIEQLLDDTEDEQVRKRAFSAVSKLGGGG